MLAGPVDVRVGHPIMSGLCSAQAASTSSGKPAPRLFELDDLGASATPCAVAQAEVAIPKPLSSPGDVRLAQSASHAADPSHKEQGFFVCQA